MPTLVFPYDSIYSNSYHRYAYTLVVSWDDEAVHAVEKRRLCQHSVSMYEGQPLPVSYEVSKERCNSLFKDGLVDCLVEPRHLQFSCCYDAGLGVQAGWERVVTDSAGDKTLVWHMAGEVRYLGTVIVCEGCGDYVDEVLPSELSAEVRELLQEGRFHDAGDGWFQEHLLPKLRLWFEAARGITFAIKAKEDCCRQCSDRGFSRRWWPQLVVDADQVPIEAARRLCEQTGMSWPLLHMIAVTGKRPYEDAGRRREMGLGEAVLLLDNYRKRAAEVKKVTERISAEATLRAAVMNLLREEKRLHARTLAPLRRGEKVDLALAATLITDRLMQNSRKARRANYAKNKHNEQRKVVG